MAKKTVLSLVAALVASGLAHAQDAKETFDEACRLLRTNQRAEALAKFEELLASEPSNEESFELWRTTDQSIFYMLLAERGEFEKVAKSLMEKATLQRKEMSRDTDAIRALVENAISADYQTYSTAQAQLAAEYGEFAVPTLVSVLGNADEDAKQNRAMLALMRIGFPATLPLIESLKSDNVLLRRNAAATLVQIGDSRAAAAFARLVKGDENESVRAIAQHGLDALGANASAVDLYLDRANDYLVGQGLRDGDRSEVVWTWTDGALKAHDVPAPIYHLELAKQFAQEGLRLDPASDRAKSLVARSYLAQAAAIEEHNASGAEDEGMQNLAEMAPVLRMVASGFGPAVLGQAMLESMDDGQGPVAQNAAAEAGNANAASSPLVEALESPDTRVSYEAALSLAKASGGSNVPAAQRVVSRLGEAVTEEAIRLIKVVDSNQQSLAVAMNASNSVRGIAIDAASSGEQGIADFYSFPNYDVVVVADSLPDRRPEDVISLIRRRNPNVKLLLLSSTEEVAEGLADKVDGVIQGPLSGSALIEKANEVVDDLEPKRLRANEVAVQAGNALFTLASRSVDISSAQGALAHQLDRDDAVAVPAAKALGAGGDAGCVGALTHVVASDASGELRVASAEAIGNIAARAGQLPAGVFDQLFAVATDAEQDMALRSAVVAALGKGNPSPGESLKLVEALGFVAATNSDG